MKPVPPKSLVVRSPWVELLMTGEKTWELRTKPTNVRGAVGLIRAGSGLIVGEAKLVDVVGPLDEGSLRSAKNLHRADDIEAIVRNRWLYGWVFEGARCYVEAVRYRHPPGAVVWVRTEPSP
ncbi:MULTISPECIES: ASCH domain-containing protein [unclassified Aureimonas]|uniref:ASCH domain-containing protein n=1 Tax=Aureimonas sp. Leaf427 TaxID=1736375 RepID=UPI0007010239|nr:hypothetical protein ASG62_08075 [Aureimonas sp. Leaf427]KQT79458.1 hypothetical protein ASG54_10670 [Aureimonas sp. Leaf460]